MSEWTVADYFLFYPWHPICARAVLQLGTESENTFCKTNQWKVSVKLQSFPIHGKESSTPTDLLSVQQSWIQDESNVEHCMTKWLICFVKYLDFICGFFFLRSRHVWIQTMCFIRWDFLNKTFILLQPLKKHSNGLHQLHCLLCIYQWQTVLLSSKSRS